MKITYVEIGISVFDCLGLAGSMDRLISNYVFIITLGNSTVLAWQGQ
jgi:hypothetical protein